MVDAGVEAEFALHITAFVGTPGNADRACTSAFGELANDRADRTRGSRDDDRLAAPRPADIAEPDIGGEPGHAEHAERGRQRPLVWLEFDETVGRHRAVKLPTITAQDVIARTEARIARSHDPPDNAAFHDRTDLDRSGVGALRAHTAAHQRFAGGGVGHRRVDDLEIIGGRRAGRPPFQPYLPVLVFHAASPREAMA